MSRTTRESALLGYALLGYTALGALVLAGAWEGGGNTGSQLGASQVEGNGGVQGAMG